MAGKVFLSCGQSSQSEKDIALQIKKTLEQEHGLNCYIAFKVQSLSDIMIITEELKSSDYYIFVDFIRKTNKPTDIPISLFTHQELALAHHVGFGNIIAFQQEGAPLEGFIKYVLSNPEKFNSKDDLINKIKVLVKERGWTSEFSRNLIVEDNGFVGPLPYGDHTGTNWERVYQVKISNWRPDIAAIRTVCILDFIKQMDGVKFDSPDRSYLKWAGQQGYERTILPKDNGYIDLFAIRASAPGIYLHSLCDVHPRHPIIPANGKYELNYKLFSEGFPMLNFAVELTLNWQQPKPSTWDDLSTAGLVKNIARLTTG
jgi:hypothetical protein